MGSCSAGRIGHFAQVSKAQTSKMSVETSAQTARITSACNPVVLAQFLNLKPHVCLISLRVLLLPEFLVVVQASNCV